MSNYKSNKGKLVIGDSISLLKGKQFKNLKGKANLLITSPSFPLNSKKRYGNEKGKEYLEWFTKLAPIFLDLLTDDGSLVIEIGNSWESGRPVQSLLHLECLMALVKHPDANLRLIQEFICYNPSKLPAGTTVTSQVLVRIFNPTLLFGLASSEYM